MITRTLIAAGAVALVALLAGCAASEPVDLTVDPSVAYEGPPIDDSVVEGQHALSVTVPTGGWRVFTNRVTRHISDNRVYITMVRPDPDAMQTQVLTRFDVTPGVPADEPLAVYARVLAHDANQNDTPFLFAKAVEPVRQ